jgi:hypothetical protein
MTAFPADVATTAFYVLGSAALLAHLLVIHAITYHICSCTFDEVTLCPYL